MLFGEVFRARKPAMDAEKHAKSFSNSRCCSNSHHVVLSAFGLLCSLLLLCVERNRSKLDIVVGYCCCRRYCFSLPVYVLSFRRFFISPVHCLLPLISIPPLCVFCVRRYLLGLQPGDTCGLFCVSFAMTKKLRNQHDDEISGHSRAALTIMESSDAHECLCC